VGDEDNGLFDRFLEREQLVLHMPRRMSGSRAKKASSMSRMSGSRARPTR
jgi:hypothetical protein